MASSFVTALRYREKRGSFLNAVYPIKYHNTESEKKFVFKIYYENNDSVQVLY